MLIYWYEDFNAIFGVYTGAIWWLIDLVNLYGVVAWILAVIRGAETGDADDVAAV